MLRIIINHESIREGDNLLKSLISLCDYELQMSFQIGFHKFYVIMPPWLKTTFRVFTHLFRDY